jgi:hypothetical protein
MLLFNDKKFHNIGFLKFKNVNIKLIPPKNYHNIVFLKLKNVTTYYTNTIRCTMKITLDDKNASLSTGWLYP